MHLQYVPVYRQDYVAVICRIMTLLHHAAQIQLRFMTKSHMMPGFALAHYLIDVSASLVPYHILCSMTTFSFKQYPITSNGPAGEWADSGGGSDLCGVP